MLDIVLSQGDRPAVPRQHTQSEPSSLGLGLGLGLGQHTQSEASSLGLALGLDLDLDNILNQSQVALDLEAGFIQFFNGMKS